MTKKSTEYGGQRKGAGRKAGVTFEEPTKPYTIRIPITLFNELQEKYGKNLRDKIRETLHELNKKEID